MNERKITVGWGINGLGALALLILFFLPWVRLSCESTDLIELSGWEIAAGTDVTNSQPVAWLVLLAAVALIIIAIVAIAINRVADKGLIFTRIGIFVVGVLGFVLLWLQNRSELEGIEVEYQYGAFGSLIALVICLAGAIVDLLQGQNAAPGVDAWPEANYGEGDADWPPMQTNWDEGGGAAVAPPTAMPGDAWNAGPTQWGDADFGDPQPTPHTEMARPENQLVPQVAPSSKPSPAKGTVIVDRRKPKAIAALIEAHNPAQSHPVSEEMTIGRAEDNDIKITTGKVSRHHAKIRREEGVFYIYDMGSSNGTFVDGVDVHTQGRLELKDGSRVRLGDVELIFSILGK